ncbi:MAG: hypothetical protein EBZ49_00190 [Proteobacteria bacterium]|nr:hypothetical protein [Pseudomonadota bacterium]
MIVKLYDEVELLRDLQKDTLILIRHCTNIEPVKRFTECYDILGLTIHISKHFPIVANKPPDCDEAALLHLRRITQELGIFYQQDFPRPLFLGYLHKVIRLLTLYQVPRNR